MVEVRGITKRYGPHVAVNDVGFSIGKGEIVGFLGPNGAGKSTTMNILTGYLSTTEGEVTIDGMPILEYPEEIKRKLGYLPENPPLYVDMTVTEYLKFVAQIKGVAKKTVPSRIAEVLETVKITDVRKRLVKNLSKGYKQRVGLAQALIGDPEILIFDEPTSGLDPKQIIEIRDLIRTLGENHTVILSSHILHEVSAICRRVMIMNLGRIVADGNPDTLAIQHSPTGQLIVTVLGEGEKARATLADVAGVTRVTDRATEETGAVEFVLDTDGDVRPKVFEAMSSAKLTLIQMRVNTMSLEELFLQLTSGEQEVPA